MNNVYISVKRHQISSKIKYLSMDWTYLWWKNVVVVSRCCYCGYR